MILKETFLNVADATRVKYIKAFHLYGGFKRSSTSVGYFIKGSVRLLKKKAQNPYLRKKYFKKGNVTRGLVIRQRYLINRVDSSSIKFQDNSLIIFKKKNTFYSRHTIGPVPFELRKKRFIQLFEEQI